MISRSLMAVVLAATAAVGSAAGGPLQMTSSILIESRAAAADFSPPQDRNSGLTLRC